MQAVQIEWPDPVVMTEEFLAGQLPRMAKYSDRLEPVSHRFIDGTFVISAFDGATALALPLMNAHEFEYILHAVERFNREHVPL